MVAEVTRGKRERDPTNGKRGASNGQSAELSFRPRGSASDNTSPRARTFGGRAEAPTEATFIKSGHVVGRRGSFASVSPGKQNQHLVSRASTEAPGPKARMPRIRTVWLLSLPPMSPPPTRLPSCLPARPGRECQVTPAFLFVFCFFRFSPRCFHNRLTTATLATTPLRGRLTRCFRAACSAPEVSHVWEASAKFGKRAETTLRASPDAETVAFWRGLILSLEIDRGFDTCS